MTFLALTLCHFNQLGGIAKLSADSVWVIEACLLCGALRFRRSLWTVESGRVFDEGFPDGASP